MYSLLTHLCAYLFISSRHPHTHGICGVRQMAQADRPMTPNLLVWDTPPSSPRGASRRLSRDGKSADRDASPRRAPTLFEEDPTLVVLALKDKVAALKSEQFKLNRLLGRVQRSLDRSTREMEFLCSHTWIPDYSSCGHRMEYNCSVCGAFRG